MAAISIATDINVDNITNRTWCAVATGGTVAASSIDPVAGAAPWVARTLPRSLSWNSVCFGDKLVVAVAGSTTYCASSGDGITWYENVLTTSKVWQSICYGNGTFVVVANGAVDTNVSTDGTLFTAGGNMQDAAAWYSVCYGTPTILGTVTPMFVSVATTGAVVASNSIDNGATWNRTTIAAGNWQAVCYGTPTISNVVTPRFVAVSYGSNAVAYSDDGTTWSAATLPNSRNWSYVTYGNGLYVTCAYGTNVAAYSTNGVNWTEVTLPSIANWNCISYGITQNQDLAVFTITAKSNAGLASCVSYDGIVWFAAIALNAAYNCHCYAPFPWNSGDTLTINNNATVSATTNQDKFWKTITGTFGKLQISNDLTTIGGGKTFKMGRVSGAAINAILPQSGLFSIDIDGAWIYLDNGDNTVNQKFVVPFTEYIPTIEVETDVADVYEVWCNVTGAIGPYPKIIGKDGLEWVGNGKRGNYFVQTPSTNPVVIPVLTNGSVKIGSHYVTFDAVTANTILPGANIVGTGIPAASVVNRVISTTKVELSTQCTATNTGLTLYVYNPFRSQFTAEISVGDGINGNKIPVGRKVRCANLMISDSSPANIASTSHQTDASIDMSSAGKLNAQICLFGDLYMNITQAAEAFFRHIGFAYQISLVETYVIDFDYIGIAASPTYWYYASSKWIIRDQRYGLTQPVGYTAPGFGCNMLWSYIHNAKIKNLHMVAYSSSAFATSVHFLTLSFTNDSVWENIRITLLWNTRPTYGLYFLDSCFRNTITNLQIYGINPISLNLSSDNVFSNIEYSLSMNSVIQSFKTVMRIADDPSTGLPLVDNTKYYFKSRSFRSWMDRGQYFDSNEYSNTAFQGGWQFPDYLSIRPTETIARSVTLDWVQRAPSPGQNLYEIYRSETEGFTDRTPANRVFSTLTAATVTAAQGVKLHTLSNAAVIILTFDSATKKITRSGSTAGSWLTDGFVVGDTVYIAGSFKGNDGAKTVTVLTATEMTVSETLYAEVTLANQVLEVSRTTSKSSATVPFSITTARVITRATGWIAVEGFATGDVVDITGSRNSINNGTFTVTAAATTLTMNEPMAAEVTPQSTSAAARIMTWDSGTKTIVLSGASASTWTADGWFKGDIFYVSGSAVGNFGPYTIADLTNSNKTITTTEAFTSEIGNAAPVLVVYRKIQIALRAPVPGVRYYYRFRKYNFNSIAALGCSNPGWFQSVTRVVTGGNLFTLTTGVGHNFIVGQSVKISGFADSAYNGTFTVNTVPSLTTFTISLVHANDSGGDATCGKISAADIITTKRALSNNVATITTSTPHLFVPLQSVVVSAMTDATYNGTFNIVSVPTTTTFTYALTHADEVETADITGLVENNTLFSAINIVSRKITISTSVSSGTKSMTFNAAAHTIVLGLSDWVTDGFVIWDTITVSGSALGNNGTYTVKTISTVTMTVVEDFASNEVGNASPVITVTGQPMAQLTTPVAHGFVFGQTITVSNVQNSVYNGTFNIRALPSTTTLQYVVNSVAEGVTADNSGKITNPNMDFDNVYYLAGFQFASGTKYLTNLVNNIYNSMFAPGIIISGRGIAAGTKVVEVDLSGRWMTIDHDTTTSSDAIFATTYSVIRRSASSTAATLVTSSAHTMEVGDKIRISGMTDSSYNGTFIITAVPSNTRVIFAHTHAAEVEVIDTTGTITVIDLCLTIPAQAGLAVWAVPGTSPGIQAGTTIVSKESSSMITLSLKPTWVTQYANVFLQTFTESPELTCVPNYYAQTMNYCLQSRVMGTTWAVSNATVTTANTYLSPTTNDWTTATMDLITASGTGGYIYQTVSGLLENTQYTASIYLRADQTQAIPLGVAGTLSLGTTDTAFTATNEIKRYSATVTTGAGVTSLVFKVAITTNGQAIHIGDAMLNAGATAQSHIPTTTVPVALFPQATPLVQLRSYCRSKYFTGTVGNQGIEINISATPATGEYFTELHVSTTPGFTPSTSTLAACTFAADTANFYLLGQANRNEFSNILKVGGGAAAAALSIFYLNTTSTDNVFKDCDIDMQYCNHATVPAIYTIASSHNNLFHNIDFGRFKNYLSSSSYYQATAINALTGTKIQNVRTDNYDIPLNNQTLNATVRGLTGGRSTPASTVAVWPLASTIDGLQGVVPTAVYGSQFYETYTGPTEGVLQAVMEDSTTSTKPYIIKAGIPKFTNTGRIEMVNANSVVSVSRARATNIATIVTALPHKIISGDEINVSGLGGTNYNGTQTVTSVPTTTSFTYANTGTAEDITADTTGTITVGDSVEFIWPYQILGISGFRKLFPKILQVDLGTQTDFPESIKVEVSTKTLETDLWGAYIEATPANLNAISVSPTVGFYFKFKLTARLFMKYSTMTNPMLVGDTIKGALSGQTAIVVENDNYGLTGTLILKNISGLFLPGEYIVDGTGTTNTTTYRAVATNVATITTSTAHGINPGFWVTISGMTDTTYNGNYLVTTAPTTTTFTYALTHANEGSTADTGGTVILSANRALNVATNGFAVGPSLTSYVSMIQFFTSYTDTSNDDNLYPSNDVSLVLDQLLSGSTVGIFNDGNVELKSGLSTDSYTYTYGWFGVSHNYSYRVRKAGYTEIDIGWTTSESTITIPVFQTKIRTVSDASGYTGITIDGQAKTIIVTTNHTHLDLYDYAQWWSCQINNISYQIPLTISVDEKTLILTSGWKITMQNASLTDLSRDISAAAGAVIYESGGSYQDINETEWKTGSNLYYASAFTHTIIDGTNAIVGAQLTYFDSSNTNYTYNISKTLVDSLATDSSGIASGYVVYKIDSTTLTGHYVKVRKYKFLTSSGTRTVNGSSIVDTITLTADNFAVATESTVGDYLGIALDYTTKIITITADHSLTHIYEYIRYSDSLAANIDQPDTISTSDGTNYLLTANWNIDIADNVTVTATGKKLVMSGTGTYDLNISGQFIGIMADATKTRVPITLTGVVVGSRCRIEKSSDNTTIYNDEPSSSTVTAYYEHITDTPINIIVRKSSAPSKYLPYEIGSTITSTGTSVSIAQIFDTFVLDSYGSISSDWAIDVDLKTINHINGATVYTVTQLYSWLQDHFDELNYLSDQIPISASTPTEFNLINGWFIDDLSFKYLSGGAITSAGHDTEIYVLTMSGTPTNPDSSDINLNKIVQNGDASHTGTLLAYTTTAPYKWYIRKITGVFTTSESITIETGGIGAGTIGSVSTGESVWSNIFTLGSLVSNTTLDVYQNDIQITPWWGTGQIDILIKVKESGTKIDNSYLTVLARTYKSLYDHFVIDATSGRNPVPLAAFTDGNNQTESGIVAAYTGFTFTFGHASKDLANGNNAQPYDCVIDCNNHTISEVYEYLKYATRSGSSTTLNGVQGEFYIAVGDIRFDYDHETGSNFSEGEQINGTGGVYGHLVSLIDNGDTGTMVLRNIHGVFIDNMNLTGLTTNTTAQVNGTVDTITPQKQSPFGSLAGGKFFGARGVWLENVAAVDANNYQLIDSTGTTQAPPSSIYITVSGLEIGDVVSVFRTTGNNKIINKTYLTSHASSNTSGSTSFTIIEDIPSDTPESGVIRIVDTSENSEKRYSYTSYLGKVFSGITKLFGTLDAGLDQDYVSDDTAYVPYVDTIAGSAIVSVAITFSEVRYIYANVRHKGIVPFDVKGTITSTGYSLTAIRTTDSIVS